MIQRIQTVYLLVIAILMIVTLFSPLATLVIGGQVCTFDAAGLSTTLTEKPELLFPTWGLFVLSAVIALIAMVTIFLYRKRILQIRLSVFNGLLMLGFYGLFIYYMSTIGAGGEQMNYSLKIALGLPLVCLILDYLAIRNIGADEILVRSLDRLR